MADLNLSASPSSGGRKPKVSASKVPTTGTPKLCMSPAGGHSPMSRTVGAIVGVVSVVTLTLTTFLSSPSAPTTQSTEMGTRTTASSVTPVGHTTRVSAEVEDIVFTPNHIEVPVSGRLVIDFTNSGDQRHDLVFETGVSSGSLASSETKELNLGIISGDAEGQCFLSGRHGLGMTLYVQATSASSSSPSSLGTSASGSHAHHGYNCDQGTVTGSATLTALTDYAETIDVRDPILPPATNEAEHRHTFTVTKQTVNVTSSPMRESRTPDGGAPGPILRRYIGGTFHITLVNNGMMSYSLDFHAGLVAPDNVMRPIEPGQILEYILVAENMGIWLYHCSTAFVSVYITDSIFGAVVVDSTDLDKIDRGYVMVAFELYLGADGQPTDALLLSALQPSAMAPNGASFQYKAYPIWVKTNERVCMRVMDAGPNLATASHVAGTQFDIT